MVVERGAAPRTQLAVCDCGQCCYCLMASLGALRAPRAVQTMAVLSCTFQSVMVLQGKLCSNAKGGWRSWRLCILTVDFAHVE